MIASAQLPSSARPLALRLRPDLEIATQRCQGVRQWIVKDPLALQYYRFHEPEYRLLEMLREPISLEAMQEQYERRFAPETIRLDQLQHFLASMHQSGLILSEASGQGEQLWRQRCEAARRRRRALFANLLCLRWRGVDPNRLLTRLLPLANGCFSPSAVAVVLIAGMAALLLIGTQWETFQGRLPAFREFFGPANWFWLALALGGVKGLHELGHGLACKRYGGECHEIGFMLLIFSPALYCNVSDSWLLPSRWQRAAIGAAGMYVELALATGATFVWWITEPGLLNHLCLSVMFVSSVSTLLFNANPLMRFDGYYILADLVEQPNLRQKSGEVLRQTLFRWLLGVELPDDPTIGARQRRWLLLFGVASTLYRWTVVVSIAMFLNALLEPYGFKPVGQFLAVVTVGGLIVQPASQIIHWFRQPGRWQQVKLSRLTRTSLLCIVPLAAICLVPLPRYATGSFTVQPENGAAVYVRTPGNLARVCVTSGEWVEQGTLLAELSNPTLRRELLQLQQRADQLQARQRLLRRQRYTQSLPGDPLATVAKQLTAVEREYRQRQAQVEELRIVAPVAGCVYPTLSSATSLAGGDLSPADHAPPAAKNHWPLAAENRGAHLAVGTQLCRIGAPGRLVANVVVDQAEIEPVRPGQTVRLQLQSKPGEILTGQVAAVAEERLALAPASLAMAAGGDLAVTTDARGGQRPIRSHYEVRVPLAMESGPAQLGLRGRARIFTGYQTLAARWWIWAMGTFHFDL